MFSVLAACGCEAAAEKTRKYTLFCRTDQQTTLIFNAPGVFGRLLRAAWRGGISGVAVCADSGAGGAGRSKAHDKKNESPGAFGA